jgi:hypothetical protein
MGRGHHSLLVAIVAVYEGGICLAIPKSLRIVFLLIFLLLGFFVYNELTSEVDEERFKETIVGLENMVVLMEAGNIEEAKREFDQIHAFFHDVDPMLREKDPFLAEQLWNAVVVIETQYGIHQPVREQLINAGNKTIALLKEAREKLR